MLVVSRRDLLRLPLLLALAAATLLLAGCSKTTVNESTTNTTLTTGSTTSVAVVSPSTVGTRPGAGSTGTSGGGKSADEQSYAKKLPSLMKSAQDNPKDLGALQQLAIAYYQTKQYDKAVDTYNKMLKIKDSAEVRNNLANVYRDMKKTDQAIKEYKAAIQADPKRVQAYVDLAALYLMSGKPDQAKTVLKDGLTKTGGDANRQLQQMLESLG